MVLFTVAPTVPDQCVGKGFSLGITSSVVTFGPHWYRLVHGCIVCLTQSHVDLMTLVATAWGRD